MACGVYRITCLANGKTYIGSSLRIADRWSAHKSDARALKHHSPHFQNVWNKYGEASFKFEIVELVEGDPLAAEQRWLDKEQPALNATLDATAPMRGKQLPPETRAKLSAAKKGVRQTTAHRAAIGAALKASGVCPPGMAGRSHVQATKEKQRAAARAQWAARRACV